MRAARHSSITTSVSGRRPLSATGIGCCSRVRSASALSDQLPLFRWRVLRASKPGAPLIGASIVDEWPRITDRRRRKGGCCDCNGGLDVFARKSVMELRAASFDHRELDHDLESELEGASGWTVSASEAASSSSVLCDTLSPASGSGTRSAASVSRGPSTGLETSGIAGAVVIASASFAWRCSSSFRSTARRSSTSLLLAKGCSVTSVGSSCGGNTSERAACASADTKSPNESLGACLGVLMV